MNKPYLLSTLGLAYRANKIISGEEMTLEKIKSKKALLVFLASDAGPNTTKRIHDKTSFYQIPLNTSLSGDEISKAIGKENRKVLCVLDKNFVALLERAMQE